MTIIIAMANDDSGFTSGSGEDLYVTGVAMSQFVLGAERLGLDGRGYMREAGLDPDVHLNPLARVPVPPYERVLLDMILDSEDELFGVHICEHVMLPLYGSLVSLALSATSLLEAIRAAIPFQGLVAGNAGGFSITQKGNNFIFRNSVAHQNPVLRRHINEGVITLMARVFRLITARPDLTALEVHFEHEPFSEHTRATMESILNSPVGWGMPETLIVVDRATLELPLQSHGEETHRSLKQLARQQLEALQSRETVIDEIKWHLRDLIVSGVPRRVKVAERMNISERTLDRRLADVGLNWQTLLDNFRSQLAREYLSGTTLSIETISRRLGFTSPRSFPRRFKSWTGMAPSEYRATQPSGNERKH